MVTGSTAGAGHNPTERAFQTTDADVAVERITSLLGPHRLEISGRQRNVAFRHHHSSVGGLGLNQMSYGRSLRTYIEPPDDRYFVVFPLAGAFRAIDGHRTENGSCDSFVIISPEQPISLEFAPDFREVCLRIDKTHIDMALTRILGQRTCALVAFPSFPVKLNNHSRGLRDLSLTLLRNQLGTEAGNAPDPVARCLEETIATMLITGVVNNYTPYICDAFTERHASSVARATQYIRSRVRERLCTDDIVSASGLGRTALFREFRKYHQLSPMEFLHKERLRLAYLALSTCRPNRVTVLEIALDCGFTHFSRFSASYRACFGELPGDTLQRSSTKYSTKQ